MAHAPNSYGPVNVVTGSTGGDAVSIRPPNRDEPSLNPVDARSGGGMDCKHAHADMPAPIITHLPFSDGVVLLTTALSFLLLTIKAISVTDMMESASITNP